MSMRTMSSMRILVVDDEPAVRESLRRALQLEGYEVELAGDGAGGARPAGRENTVDAVVLDVSMPRLDGLETCRRLRSQGSALPVLMLTARDEVADRVAGLDAGADDYVVKPFALEELLARLRALLRRAAPAEDGDVLRFADVELDPATREVRRGGDPIELTRTEFTLLELFLLNPRQVLTRSIIFERVWGYDFGFGSNSLDVYIGYLRRKTEQGGKPRLIQTIRGVGYALRERVADGARSGVGFAGGATVASRRSRSPSRSRSRSRSRRRRRSPTCSCGTSCAARSTTRCGERVSSVRLRVGHRSGDRRAAARPPARPLRRRRRHHAARHLGWRRDPLPRCDRRPARSRERARQTAAGDHRPFFADARVAGTHLRVYTLPVDSPGLALQIARPLEEVDAALDRIRVLLFLIAAVGIALAAALGLHRRRRPCSHRSSA